MVGAGVGVAAGAFAAGAAADFAVCDVREPAQVAEAVQKAIEQCGRIDGLINNAAGTPACLPGLIQITSAGVVTLESTTALSGNVTTPLGGLTFQVAA